MFVVLLLLLLLGGGVFVGVGCWMWDVSCSHHANSVIADSAVLGTLGVKL